MSLFHFTRKTAVCCCLAAASPAALFAQPALTPQGVEYGAAGALPGDQVWPAAAVNSGGGYLVWQDNSANNSALRIMAERLGPSLTPGVNSPFVVSALARSRSTGDQEKPQVALLPDGGAMIVWQGSRGGRGRKGASQQVYARMLDSSGSPLKRDIRVSNHRRNSQSEPRVATLADGNVVVVWSSLGQDGSMQGVFARLFNSSGRPLGAEFQVNVFTSNNQRSPDIAALANGNFVVIWISELQRTEGSVDVYGRLFDPSGNPVSSEFLANAPTDNVRANPAVASSPLGGFAVVWSQNATIVVPTPPRYPAQNINGIMVPSTSLASTESATNGWDIFGRLFDSNAAAGTAPFQLNTYTYGDQFGPRISALGGNYLAVWDSLSQPDPNTGVIDPIDGVFGQLITSGGQLASTNDLHINTTIISRQMQPTVVSDGASRLLVTWSSPVSIPGAPSYGTLDLFAQQYLISGGQ
jgi:hypothetical protein